MNVHRVQQILNDTVTPSAGEYDPVGSTNSPSQNGKFYHGGG